MIIRYNDGNAVEDVTVLTSQNTVKVIGTTAINTSGFTTWDNEEIMVDDLSEFTTLFRSGDDFVEYSNNGSTWKEIPEISMIEETDQPEDPTEELMRRVEELEAQNEMLMDCLLEMSEIVYA